MSDNKFTPGGITFAPASEITSADLRAAWAQKEEERSRYASELNSAHAEIATLRSDLAKAREEIKHWEDKEVRRAVNCCGQEERALAAERARDEAVKAFRRAADALGWAREIGPDEVAQYDALNTVAKERDEAVAEVARLKEALAAAEWGDTDWESGDPAAESCPVCKQAHGNQPNRRAMHAPDCILARALGRTDGEGA